MRSTLKLGFLLLLVCIPFSCTYVATGWDGRSTAVHQSTDSRSVYKPHERICWYSSKWSSIIVCDCTKLHVYMMNKHFDAFIGLTALEFHLVIMRGNSAKCVKQTVCKCLLESCSYVQHNSGICVWGFFILGAYANGSNTNIVIVTHCISGVVEWCIVCILSLLKLCVTL